MRETGTVHKVRGSFATVRFDRKAACENCNMCLKPREANYVELRLENTLNAAVGDKVEVAMGDRAVLTAALLVYAVPLIVMGAALGFTYTLELWICLTVSFGAMILAFAAVSLIDRFVLRRRPEYMPKMIAVVSAESGSDTEAEESGGLAPAEEIGENSETTPDSLD